MPTHLFRDLSIGLILQNLRPSRRGNTFFHILSRIRGSEGLTVWCGELAMDKAIALASPVMTKNCDAIPAKANTKRDACDVVQKMDSKGTT